MAESFGFWTGGWDAQYRRGEATEMEQGKDVHSTSVSPPSESRIWDRQLRAFPSSVHIHLWLFKKRSSQLLDVGHAQPAIQRIVET